MVDGAESDAISSRRLLDWSSKQSRILTGGGAASTLFVPPRFSFSQHELPHHHLRAGTSHSVFAEWARDLEHGSTDPGIIIGAWSRPLFAGTWDHTTDADESVFNIQTGTLFVDIRIPNVPPRLLRRLKDAGSISDLSDEDLRLFARRHAFGGYARIDNEGRPLRPAALGGREGGRLQPICTRHHIIDWNYLSSRPRDRPNKWWIELPHNEASGKRSDAWKELSYATDDFGQHYYHERWERIDGDCKGGGVVLAMKKAENDHHKDGKKWWDNRCGRGEFGHIEGHVKFLFMFCFYQ